MRTDVSEKERLALLLSSIPKTVEKALDGVPISQIVWKNDHALKTLESALAMEILKTSDLISTSGNIKNGQCLEIAKRLIEEYPNESFEDFCLMLRNGLKGKYPIDGKNDIFRFDMLVIVNWMKGYLEEKYIALENRLTQEKDNHYKSLMEIPQGKDRDYSEWYNEVTKGDGMKPVPPLSESEIHREGSEKPKRELYPKTPASYMQQAKLHIEWIRANYDPISGKPLLTWMPEEEWIKNQKEVNR